MRVRSGPTPASERAATTLTLAGKAWQASRADPSKISVSAVIAPRSIRLLGDPRRALQTARWLSRFHGDGRDRPDSRALHPVETGNGRRGYEDTAPVCRGQVHPVVTPKQAATGEDHQLTAGPERSRSDLGQVRLGRRLDHEIGYGHQRVQVDEGRGPGQTLQEALASLAVAGALPRPGSGPGSRRREPRRPCARWHRVRRLPPSSRCPPAARSSGRRGDGRQMCYCTAT